MKKIITILVAIVVNANTFGQVPNCLWSNSAGGSLEDLVNSICTDDSGNVYVTGYFKSTTITFGTTTLINADNTGYTNDIFIVKYTPNGTVLWATSAGGTNIDEGTSLATDVNGNVYVTGYFYSPTITFGTTTLTNVGIGDIFIAKYDGAGAVLWAKSAGGTGYD
jgi:hypothetical protein